MIVRNTKCFITYIGSQFFYPGMNTISEEQSKILASEPAFQEKIKQGLLQVINQDAQPAAATQPTAVKAAVKIAQKVSISGMSAINAVKVIENTFNRDELNRLATMDQRKGVQDAVARQLEKIKLTEEEKPKE